MKNLGLSPSRKPVRVGRPKSAPETTTDDTPVKEIDLGFAIDPAKVYVFETIKKSDQRRNENLGSISKAFDPVEKRYRDMRYVPTAPSIFVEEWDESFVEMPEIPLGFWNNILTAPGEDIRLMEYLLNHPLYEHSPFRVMNKPPFFTLADKEVLENIKAKRHETEMKALELIRDGNIDDLRPIARNIFGVTEASDTAVINALNELVKKPKQGVQGMSNAEKLIDNIGNPKLLRQYHIQAGIDRGVISADLEKMRASFIDGNVFICNLTTRNPVTELANWSYGTDGAKFYSHLRSKI